MKKPIITYGLIAGGIVSAMMLITMPMYNSGALNHDNGELTGYTTMVIALSVIFFAIKSYRDKQPGATITFWKGVQIGLLVTLIAAVMYALTWEYLYSDFGDEFMAKLSQQYMTELQTSGKPEAEIQEGREEILNLMELYKNPLMRFLITIMEILPVGIIITLLASALLRKKELFATTEQA